MGDGLHKVALKMGLGKSSLIEGVDFIGSRHKSRLRKLSFLNLGQPL